MAKLYQQHGCEVLQMMFRKTAKSAMMGTAENEFSPSQECGIGARYRGGKRNLFCYLES